MAIEDSEPVEVQPTPEGGATVTIGEAAPAETSDRTERTSFSQNLVDLFDDHVLSKMGVDLIQIHDEDKTSRKEWENTYKRGLKLLGLEYEERTEPWQGACGTFSPLLLESIVRFNAESMDNLFPGSGPVKIDDTLSLDDETVAAGTRMRKDMNDMLLRKMPEYYSETDMMTFNLPLAGTTFRQFGFDEERKRPWSRYILTEHVIIPYTAASLFSSDRYSVIVPTTKEKIERSMRNGFYRTVEIGEGLNVQTAIEKEKDKINDQKPTANDSSRRHNLIEMYVERRFDEDEKTNGELAPYVITVHLETQKVLSIYRNWRRDDAVRDRMVSLVQHKYMPGFGPYGLGLLHILGGLTESATSILRQLVDAGTLANLKGGYKAKGAKVIDKDKPVSPGEWRDVDAADQTLRESFFPIEYGEPSTVLYQLLGLITDEGRRIGSVADMKIADMSAQNMPVGTTVAILERSMKVMSGVQKRMYQSFGAEYRVLSDIIEDAMGDTTYPSGDVSSKGEPVMRGQDYAMRSIIVPVADPNAQTTAVRIMIMEAILRLTQSNPEIYNIKAVHRDMIRILGSDNSDKYIPPDDSVEPQDPVTENMNLMNNEPVKAGLEQNHQAHIDTHLSMLDDPHLESILKRAPEMASAIMAATMAHVQEHVAMQYRRSVEELLGVPLPPPGQPLPEDMEYELSGLISEAAAKVLDKHQAEARAQEIIDTMEDPVIQNEREKLRIEDQKRADKLEIEKAKIADKDRQRKADVFQFLLKQMAETERSTIVATLQMQTKLTEQQLEAADLAARIGDKDMDRIMALMLEGLRSSKNSATQNRMSNGNVNESENAG